MRDFINTRLVKFGELIKFYKLAKIGDRPQPGR